ncbi:MAG: hypothetical protein LQ337_006838 [Flavoplaca oasis]|nr:MAG: hypothetical protein LQ337_006838 [Flavoplaca oasis]
MASTASSSLWDKAVQSLSDEDKQSIDFSQTDKPTILADVLQAAEQKKQLCMQKRWKFTKKNGHVIIVRDVCEKIIKWIHKFKEIGDVAAQYDPSHASLPWAAVRFFLQLSVNDVQTFGAMAEGLETVASHITRCKTYEDHYLSPSSSSSIQADLKSHLLCHYAVILTYLATARRYYTKSTVCRLAASVFETSDSVDACLSNIAAGRDEVERCARLIDSELLRGINSTGTHTQVAQVAIATDLKSLSTSQGSHYQSLKDIMSSFEQPILRAAAQVSEIHASLAKGERRKILTWLSTVQYREHHRTSFDAVMPGSGTWLQNKPEFVDWKTSSASSILWIHGIPGSGKSKLMSIVIQDILEAKLQNTSTSAFSYFYCTRDVAEKERANPDEIMRAVLKQLSCPAASQPIHAAVLREYRKRQKDADEDGLEPSKLPLRDCKNLILEISDQLPIVVMVDALDECDPLRRHELLQVLGDIVQTSNSLVKVIISSRDDIDISCRLAGVPNVYISSDDSRDDLNRFVEQELDKAIEEQRLLRGQVPSCLRQQIIDRLRAGANGMFLWAHLQIQNLCDPERMIVASDVEDALQRLPTTLVALYSNILDRIDRIAPHGRLLATKTLSWLLCARMPLGPAVLPRMLQMCSSKNPDQEILGLCCNLVVLDKSLNVFRFAHASVREFLESQPGFSYRKINSDVAKDCVREILNAPTPTYAGLEYAASSWRGHYLAFDVQSEGTTAKGIVPTLFADKTFYIRRFHGDDLSDCWVEFGKMTRLRIHPSKKSNATLMRLTSKSDVLALVEAIFECSVFNVNQKTTKGRSIFDITLCNSDEGILKVEMAPEISNPTPPTSFHLAIISREAIALLLLQYDSRTEVPDDELFSMNSVNMTIFDFPSFIRNAFSY